MTHKHFSEEEIILLVMQENNFLEEEIKVCPQCNSLYQQYTKVLSITKLLLNKSPACLPEKIKTNVLQKLTKKNKKVLLPNIFKFSLYPALAVAIILLLIIFPPGNNRNNLSKEEIQIVQNIEILQNAELLTNLDLFINDELDEDNVLINSNGD